jgi:CheY-like chemotaxis protein
MHKRKMLKEINEMADLEKEYKYDCIMIVDDSNIDLYVAEQILKSIKGASQIIAKQSAIEALQYLTANSADAEKLPQLILLDIQMPGMDGFGFLEEYKKLPDAIVKNIRIIMLSSTVDPTTAKG